MLLIQLAQQLIMFTIATCLTTALALIKINNYKKIKKEGYQSFSLQLSPPYRISVPDIKMNNCYTHIISKCNNIY